MSNPKVDNTKIAKIIAQTDLSSVVLQLETLADDPRLCDDCRAAVQKAGQLAADARDLMASITI